MWAGGVSILREARTAGRKAEKGAPLGTPLLRTPCDLLQSRIRGWLQSPEQSVLAAQRRCGEIQRAGVPAIPTVTPLQAPQSVDRNVVAFTVLHRSQVR